MALRNLLPAASILAATSTKGDPWAHCLKALAYISRSERVEHTNCYFHQISECKLLPAKPCCLCCHVFQEWFSWSPTQGTSRPCGCSCMLGCDCSQTVPRVVLGGACLLCSCVMPCTEKGLNLEIPERVISSGKWWIAQHWTLKTQLDRVPGHII